MADDEVRSDGPTYQVPPDWRTGPDYQVPLNTARDGCPRCGSRAILPSSDTVMRFNGMPRRLQVSQCAQCGTRYRVQAPMPTWADLGRDAMSFAVIAVVLVIVIALCNLLAF